MDQALDRAVANGVKKLVVQPTHLMHGAEYDELMEAVEAYKDQFASVKVAEPLLGEVGEDVYKRQSRIRDTPPQSSCSFAAFRSWQEMI